ncbi:BTB/POZ domain-containing protein At4g30940-like [Lycium ferocissimum]|uniref:BTB/POZ domain-containing protein At4g30940-like n=1 Tax=Lycium ferocissimum TaxID=112874 RepID=UPI0028151094|nr:BTB/POZ domain-containing protein At4g30940-like [Lycium ferocissimum]
MKSQKDRVKLNVGGTFFETTATTLAGAGRNSFFGAMFDENWNLHSNAANTEHFIDRDPDYFAVLLNLLRTGELYIPPNIDKKHLYREAEYYGILDHVRSAKWGPFDGNRLRLAGSITGPTIRGALRYFANFEYCCCVVYGRIVKVYNWMLEEQPTITCDYCWVNDVSWVDSENIVISSNAKLDSGGMGLFSASTGELRYKFQVTDERKGYTPGALSFSSDYKLFSSCKSTSNKHVIGVWDQVTGKQMDFLPHSSNSNAIRLQWLHGTNCLMVASCCCINLFDFRKNTVVLSWSYDRDRVNKPYVDPTNFRDVIAIEESNSICVVDLDERLGFMDLRSTTDASVEWREPPRGKKHSSLWAGNKLCSPKLAFHEGQLFSSIYDTISVYCGSNWLPISELQQSRVSNL